MLFGNLFAGLACAAMAIAPVVCAPTAKPEVSVSEVKRTTIGDHARTCYSGVQTHCNNINNHIQQNNGVISVSVAADISVELHACLSLLVTLSGQVTAVSLGQDDLEDCGPVFVNIVTLLTSILRSISGACQPGAITVLVSVVASLLARVTLLSSSLLTAIEGLLALLLLLLGGILATLQVNISNCVSSFTSACGAYH